MRLRARTRQRSYSSGTTGSTPLMKFLTMSGASARGSLARNSGPPMPYRLLDRQNRLLDYLTSGPAIFGGSGEPAHEPVPSGIDRGLLRLEARYSHEKRMAKIEWVLNRTLGL